MVLTLPQEGTKQSAPTHTSSCTSLLLSSPPPLSLEAVVRPEMNHLAGSSACQGRILSLTPTMESLFHSRIFSLPPTLLHYSTAVCSPSNIYKLPMSITLFSCFLSLPNSNYPLPYLSNCLLPFVLFSYSSCTLPPSLPPSLPATLLLKLLNYVGSIGETVVHYRHHYNTVSLHYRKPSIPCPSQIGSSH